MQPLVGGGSDRLAPTSSSAVVAAPIEAPMLFLFIILIVLSLGGGGWGYSRYGTAGLGPAGVILVVLAVLFFTGRFH